MTFCPSLWLEDQMKKKSCHLQDLSYPEVVKKTSTVCYKSLKSCRQVPRDKFMENS